MPQQKHRLLYGHFALFAALFLVISCAGIQKPLLVEPVSKTIPVPKEIPVPEEIPVYSVSLIAAGDNLINQNILDDCKDNGAFNFSPLYTEVETLIAGADIAFINQETIMAGPRFAYSGYPRFNTPSSIAVTLAGLGFNTVNHANNHVMDMGEAGIIATLDTWDAIDSVSCIGIQRTEEKSPRIVTRNNISFGFLAYTYGTNGLGLPKGKPWMVSMIDRERIAGEVNALRPLCDFLVVSMHWGDEYFTEPNQQQKSLALFLAELGVDLVIGHHPHVLQRIEYIERHDGKKTLVFYSLGNFVSNQDRKETQLGAFAYISFNKIQDRAFINDAGLIPVFTHIEPGYKNTKVYPFFAYNDLLMQKHRLHAKDRDFNMDFYNAYLAGLNTKLFMYNPMQKTVP